MTDGADLLVTVAGAVPSALLIVGAWHLRGGDHLGDALEVHGLVQGSTARRLASIGLPLVEGALGLVGLAAAVALVPVAAAATVFGAIALLYVGFAAYGATVLHRSRTPVPCGCGGAASMSPAIVTRAVACAVAAAVAGIVGSPGSLDGVLPPAVAAVTALTVVSWVLPALLDELDAPDRQVSMSIADAALILSWIVIVLLALALAGLARQIHTIATRMGLMEDGSSTPVGVSAPGEAETTRGATQQLIAEVEGSFARHGDVPHLVVAVSRSCRSCAQVVDHLATVDSRSGDRLGIVVVEIPTTAKATFDLASLPESVTVAEVSSELAMRLRIPALPFAAGLASTGRIVLGRSIGRPQMLDEIVDVLLEEVPSEVG